MASDRVKREAVLQWVPIEKMRVPPAHVAQRPMKESWVEHLVATFRLEEMGHPIVNHRDGYYYLIDGQHRIEALRRLGFEDYTVQCEVYEGLSEEEEAERFLTRNDQLTVDVFSKFKIGVAAGRPKETMVNNVLVGLGLRAATDDLPGAVGAVGTLMRVYERSDAVVLGRALYIIREGFGDSGFDSHIIDGVGHLIGRYPEVDDNDTVAKLQKFNGGVGGVLNKAYASRERFGGTIGANVAASLVEHLNRGRGGKKLPSWWK